MLSHWEHRIGMLYLTEFEQDIETGILTPVSTKPLFPEDLVHPTMYYISEPCSGSVSPWGSFLSSQEYPFDTKWFKQNELDTHKICQFWNLGGGYGYTSRGIDQMYPHVNWTSSVWEWQGKVCDETKTLDEIKAEWYENYVPFYWNGLIVETEVIDADGTVTMTPHFSSGRVSAEKPLVMPDEKTMYITEDYSNQGFYKFIADTPGDLSAGTLYVAKFYQTVPDDTNPTDATFDIEWIDLGHAADSDFDYDLISTYTTTDWFDLADPLDGGVCPEGFKAYSVNNVRSDNTECVRLKEGADVKLASRLETQRYGAWLGASQELTKVEGITFDSDRGDRFYISAGGVTKSMLNGDTTSPDDWDYCDANDVRLEENKRGCIFAMIMDENYDVTNAETLVCGEPGSFMSADNIGYVNGYDALVLSEDTTSREGPSNFAWLYSFEDDSVTPFLQSVNNAEISMGYHYLINGWNYLVFVIQHPYQYDSTDPHDCDVLGTNTAACGEHTGTGDWWTYYTWAQEETTSDPETTSESCPTCPVCTTDAPEEAYTGFMSSLEDTACDNPGTWTFNNVAAHSNLEGVLGEGELCVDDNQYVYRLDGQTYPTCVLFANEGQDCVDDLVCTTGSGVAGFVGGQAAYVADAISRRNNYKHMDCPTIQEECTPLPTYWRTTFSDKGVSDMDLDNMCVPESLTGEVCYVMESGYQKMCVGFSTVAQSNCPVDPSMDDYLCGGISAGTHVFGWPGSIANMAAQAASEESKKHPQCRF